jgi:ADP-ribose pyrophosphatase YjhB (NUDIX family)
MSSAFVPPPVCYRLAYALLRLYWFVFRPGVRGVRCVIERGGAVLLIRHTYGERRWYFPGGAVKRGEELEAAARREAEEEVGIRLPRLVQFGEFTSTDKHMHDHVYCFRGAAPHTDVRIHRGEVREARWFAWDELPEDLSPDALRVIESYARGAVES